ncbi:MLP-like protein 43 [Arachis duranensis]|uniref:MLP-like protein 43 n=1 Tax=Arachis duranensis TaxID=130453 RepID=A0A6P4C2U2_ARADU|nr:MLP-like protein 43 [Arachis duranensis]
MALTGKLSSEIGIRAPAAKFFHLLTKQLDHVQNVCERVHETKLHEGDDWHSVGGSVKHWTYVIDGKVTTCKETVESIDEQNLSASYKLFDGDVSKHYKVFKLSFQVSDKEKINEGATVKWTIEYEKINDDVEAPYGYMEYFDKCTKDIGSHLVKA